MDAKVVGIAALAAIEIVALLKGVDGQLLATTIGIIAGLCGYCLGRQSA